MGLNPLETELRSAADLRSLARSLGSICLDDGMELSRMRDSHPRARDLADRLEQAVGSAADHDWWLADDHGDAGFSALLDEPDVAMLVRQLKPSGPLAHLAVLRAICRGPLGLFFAQTRECVELRRGDPVPPSLRPKPFRGATPAAWTLDHGHLLAGTRFRLFAGSANLPTRVLLDFSRRVELDAATWMGDASAGRFPIVATVHPWSRGDDLTAPVIEGGRFFGVWPRSWDEPRVLDQLATAGDAQIAVLPELCLPHPDTLLEGIQADPSRYPALVVCGSAHVEDPRSGKGGRSRANRSSVVLRGEPIMHHCKIHPFRTTYLGPDLTFDEPVEEDLTGTAPELRVLAGTLTRLTVAICADLQDAELPNLITAAGVNMLLAPALTPSDGAFNDALSSVASQNQGLSIIVNGTPMLPMGGDDREPAPALVLIGVPRATVGEQTHGYGRRRGRRRAVGRLDPNQPLRRAMTWPA